MGTKMLHCTGGVTRFDYVWNENIRDRYGFASIVEKLQERRFRWGGHVIHANENSTTSIDQNIESNGKQPKTRPKQWWLDTLDGDLKVSRLHPDQAFDKIKWRNRSSRADPACELMAEQKEKDVRSDECTTAPCNIPKNSIALYFLESDLNKSFDGKPCVDNGQPHKLALTLWV